MKKTVTFSVVHDEENQTGEDIAVDESMKLKSCDRRFTACYALTTIILFSMIIFYTVYDKIGDSEPSATLRLHHHRKKTCEDTEFGCCEIYTNCKIQGDHLDYDIKHLSLYRIVARDILMSNCPSLETLVYQYNRHYGNLTTDCGKFGCCPGLSVGCDNTIRQNIINGNNGESVEYYNSHPKQVPILINKIDESGSNCITNTNSLMFDVTNSYEKNYPTKGSDTYGTIILLSLLACMLVSSR